MISFIVASDKNLLIGKDNSLPWPRIPSDMRHFREKSIGKTVVMGRKTFESIGSPLKDRENVVLTRDKNFKADNVTIYTSVEEIIERSKQNPEKEFCIIGGATIYEQFLPFVDVIYYTHIDAAFEGDTFLPKNFLENFKIVEEKVEEIHEKSPFRLVFRTYVRK